MSAAITTWASAEAEQTMAEGHGPAWNAIINSLDDIDFSSKAVLDFGCNRGGFLRLLGQRRSYRMALGVDIAVQSIAEANRLKGDLPADYRLTSSLLDIKTRRCGVQPRGLSICCPISRHMRRRSNEY